MWKITKKYYKVQGCLITSIECSSAWVTEELDSMKSLILVKYQAPPNFFEMKA